MRSEKEHLLRYHHNDHHYHRIIIIPVIARRKKFPYHSTIVTKVSISIFTVTATIAIQGKVLGKNGIKDYPSTSGRYKFNNSKIITSLLEFIYVCIVYMACRVCRRNGVVYYISSPFIQRRCGVLCCCKCIFLIGFQIMIEVILFLF